MTTETGEFAEREQTRQDKAAEADALAAGIREGEDETPAEKAELLDQLTASDLVASDDTLRNLATKAFPSGNFDEEQFIENRHFLYVIKERAHAARPHEEQLVTGIDREWAHDDPDAGLEAPDKRDLVIDETYKQGVAARLTKGKDGSLLASALQSIKESVLRRGDGQESSGGILGKLRR